ncbi:GNAT family N-acetyltransferase [Rubrivivax gelatinosus]|nr:GNAT family N-acetyltransferase [Rubrivivax gelatinosus]
MAGAEAVSPPGVLIRPVVAADAAALAAFAAQAFHDTYAADNDPQDMRDYVGRHFGAALQAAEIADPQARTWIAEHAAAIVGFVQTGPEPPPSHESGIGSLRRLYVAPAWHGRGLARELVETACADAAARGLLGLWLSVWERNPRAIAFYAKSGFADVGTTSFAVGADLQRDRVMLRRF